MVYFEEWNSANNELYKTSCHGSSEFKLRLCWAYNADQSIRIVDLTWYTGWDKRRFTVVCVENYTRNELAYSAVNLLLPYPVFSLSHVILFLTTRDNAKVCKDVNSSFLQCWDCTKHPSKYSTCITFRLSSKTIFSSHVKLVSNLKSRERSPQATCTSQEM